MTPRTSEVAVCCASDSRSSLSSRAFSMGDDGLRCEVFNQLNLFVGEWPDLLAKNADSTDGLIILEHRYTECGSESAELYSRDNKWWRSE